jgi:hypothetical protein
MRLFIYDNGTENKVVIRSRGAAHLMCLWNVETNVIRKGQWSCGKKFMPNRCEYRPDGRFVYEYKKQGCSTRVIECTPPYFTAHQMWEEDCHQPLVKVISLDSRTRPRDRMTIPTVIIGSKLVDPSGVLVHDFMDDQFEEMAPPDDYQVGKRIHDTILPLFMDGNRRH